MCALCNRCCCIQNPNQDLYIEITNRGNLIVNFIMQYRVQDTIFTKESSMFHYGQMERLTFPPNALNICFNLLNYSVPNIPIIANVCLDRTQRTCFVVMGIPTDPVLIEIPC